VIVQQYLDQNNLMLLNQFISGYLSFLGKMRKIKVVQKEWHCHAY